MVRTLRQLISMRAAINANVFLYYLSRLWIIGKKIPESVYGKKELKQIVAVFTMIMGQLTKLAGKILYMMIFIILPIVLLDQKMPDGTEFDSMVSIVFFLNCILGGTDSAVFKVTREKYTCLIYMKMDPLNYVRSYLLYVYVPFFVYFLPCFLVCAWLFHAPLYKGALLWFVLMMFRAMAEALHVVLYDKKEFFLCRSTKISWIMILLCVPAAYGPLASGIVPVPASILLHPAVLLVLLILGAGSLWYVLKGYTGYRMKMHRTIDPKWITSELMKSSGNQSAAKEVGMKEKDLQIDHTKDLRKQGLTGYAYFNALFFARHRRQLIRPVYYRLAIIFVLFVCMVGLRVANPAVAAYICRQITSMLPLLVFIMYAVTVAEKACKAMFYNCDKSMLKFGFYRNPEVILKNFKIRLIRISVYNLIVGAAISAAAIVLRAICGLAPLDPETVLFAAAVLMLSVFFTVHHLFMYYVFQPYSEEMNIKNPFFRAINLAMYVISYICLQVQTGGLAFTAGVLIVTVAYTVIALVLVYRYAPKTFRVK